MKKIEKFGKQGKTFQSGDSPDKTAKKKRPGSPSMYANRDFEDKLKREAYVEFTKLSRSSNLGAMVAEAHFQSQTPTKSGLGQPSQMSIDSGVLPSAEFEKSPSGFTPKGVRSPESFIKAAEAMV